MTQTTERMIQILVAGTATSGRVTLLESVERPGYEPPLHVHHWEDELLYLMAGEIAVFLSEKWQVVPAGSVIVIPRGVEHTHAVLTETARLLTIYAPAGFEQVYQMLGTQTPWAIKDAHEVERWVAAAAQYGCEITGPHPGRPAF